MVGEGEIKAEVAAAGKRRDRYSLLQSVGEVCKDTVRSFGLKAGVGVLWRSGGGKFVALKGSRSVQCARRRSKSEIPPRLFQFCSVFS